MFHILEQQCMESAYWQKDWQSVLKKTNSQEQTSLRKHNNKHKYVATTNNTLNIANIYALKMWLLLYNVSNPI